MVTGVSLFGRSPEIVRVREDTQLASLTDANVLISGERGVGKAGIGQHLHRKNAQPALPLAVIPCSQSSSTVQFELIQAFDRGSQAVLLNDIDELTPVAQLLLMDLLEQASRRRRRVRVIACTSTPLYDLVSAAVFCEALFYRLNTIHIPVPSLRDRRPDIPGLVVRLLRAGDWRGRRSRRRLTPGALTQLVGYDWPGNLRELHQVIEHIAPDRPDIRQEDLPREMLLDFGAAPSRSPARMESAAKLHLALR